MRIIVVCAAGASSTFVAQRLRRAAADSGLDWQTTAGTLADVPGSADVILLGPHLASQQDDVRRSLPTQTPVIVLPDDVFTDHDGTRTLRLLREELRTREEQTP